MLFLQFLLLWFINILCTTLTLILLIHLVFYYYLIKFRIWILHRILCINLIIWLLNLCLFILATLLKNFRTNIFLINIICILLFLNITILNLILIFTLVRADIYKFILWNITYIIRNMCWLIFLYIIIMKIDLFIN